ncbi:MAG TPA: ferrous iron transport protein B, partial [Pyrinomonadaceae bacterium]|nr:ferrous iron transport protein B [Pyrinomonadaceae bacterium]
MSAIPRTKLAVANPLTRPLIIAVAGNPNAGKTSLFNALTGMRQKVANYPGVTVERKVGLWTLAPELPPAQLIDLPGLYSLEATSLDEQIARDALLGRAREMPTPDAVIVVVDATNLVRNLYLASQLIETKQPVVIALTMFDIAERQKLSIDVAKLGAALGVPVVPVVAKQQRGTTRLAEAVLAVIAEAESRPDRRSERVREDTTTCAQSLINRYHWIEKVVAGSLNRPHEQAKASPTERIDRVLTHKFFGPAVLLLVMLLIFQAIFSWASLPMYIIERIFNVLSETVRLNLPPGILADLLAGGVIPGVGGVLVFLPQIFLLFLFISMLEDSGYMARAVFLTDRVMRSLGLQGRALMPLLSSFACAVPGIMATRTIEDPKDRLTTILIAPFMSCSARLPVYTLMIATFFTEQRVLGQISLGVVILLSLYLLGITAAVVVAWILKHTILKASPSPFVMELPPYRLP